MSIVTTPATLLHAALGGLLIGAAASGLLLVNGRIAGIAGILANATTRGAQRWQWAFVAGLLVAGSLHLRAQAPLSLTSQNLGVLALAGLLVGFGTRLSNGCTSGHGVCGLARLSPRSGAAVLTFMAVAALTVFLRRHVL